MNINKFSDFLKALPVEQMNEETSHLFIELLIAESKGFNIPEHEWPFTFKVAIKRSTAIGVKYTQAGLIFICDQFQSVGMVCLVIHYIAHRKGVINMDSITSVFPDGFWNQKSCNLAWDYQKTKTGNYIDMLLKQAS